MPTSILKTYRFYTTLQASVTEMIIIIMISHIDLLDIYKISYILTFDHVHINALFVKVTVLADVLRVALSSGQIMTL